MSHPVLCVARAPEVRLAVAFSIDVCCRVFSRLLFFLSSSFTISNSSSPLPFRLPIFSSTCPSSFSLRWMSPIWTFSKATNGSTTITLSPTRIRSLSTRTLRTVSSPRPLTSSIFASRCQTALLSLFSPACNHCYNRIVGTISPPLQFSVYGPAFPRYSPKKRRRRQKRMLRRRLL